MTVQSVKTFLRTHKLAVILTSAGVILVALITMYILWSMSAWTQVETSASQWSTTVKDETAAALSLPADTTEKREEKRKALKKIADSITAKEGTMCQVSGLLQWQEGMSHAKPKVEDCKKKRTHLKEFADQLTPVLEYLEDERQLASAIAATGKAEKVGDKDFLSNVTAWQTAEAAIAKIEADAAFGPVKTEAANVAKAITLAWQGVVAANEAKDRKKYDEAAVALSEAYKRIEGITALSAQKFESLARDLEKRYASAF